MEIEELSTIVLKRDLPEYDLRRGDVGAIVHRYRDGTAFEVEFVSGEGRTVGVVTLSAEDVRPMQGNELLHVRELA